MSIGMEDVVCFDQVMSEYERAVDPGLVEFIENLHFVDKVHADKCEYRISDVSDRQKTDIEKLTGSPLNAEFNCIKGGAVKHIEKRHGISGKADRSMSDINDIARIGFILEKYDYVDFLRNKKGQIVKTTGYLTKDGEPAPMLMYVKRINGFYCVVEVICSGKGGRLNIVTAYKSRGKP